MAMRRKRWKKEMEDFVPETEVTYSKKSVG
jgi:hypothetical protein